MKKDTIEPQISLYLDKVYPVKLTMRSILALEDTYGSLQDALAAFYSKDDAARYRAFIDFLFVSIEKLPKPVIESLLTEHSIGAVLKTLNEVLFACLPDKKEDDDKDADKKQSDEKTFNWDILYYRARYHLRMKDNEFWKCSPRRFYRLLNLWDEEHSVKDKTNDKKTIEVDEIPGW